MLNENSFWSNDAEKAKFLKSPTMMGNAFWINYIGFCALYEIDKENVLLKQYFTQPVRVKSVKDDAGDLFVIIREHVNAGNIETTVANELTKFLALLKKGKIDKIKPILLRKTLKKIKISKVKVSAKLKPFIVGYIKGVYSLSDMIDPLYNFAKKQKRSLEFQQMARRMKSKIAPTDFNVNVPNRPTGTKINTTTKKPVDKSASVSPMDLTNFMQDTIAKNQFNKDFPLYKTNKDLVKLFMLKLVNSHRLYKVRPGPKNLITHMKKFGTTPEEMKTLLSNDDLEDMYKTKFPENNKNLSGFTNDPIFMPINDTFFSYGEENRWQKVFNYKWWWQHYLLKNSIDLYKKHEEFKGWNTEDFNKIKDRLYQIILQNFRTSPRLTISFLVNNPNWGNYWNPIIYQESDFIMKTVSDSTLKLMLSRNNNDVIKDIPYKWIKDWYNNTTKNNREMFIAKMVTSDQLYLADWIDSSTINMDDVKYNNFKEWVLSHGGRYEKIFNNINIEKMLKEINKLDDFKRDFEDDIYSDVDFFNNWWYGDPWIDNMESFLKNRKNPYSFNMIKDGDNLYRLDELIEAYDWLKKIVITQLIPKYIKDKIQAPTYGTCPLPKYCDESNWIEFYTNCMKGAVGVDNIKLNNLSISFIEKNLDFMEGKIQGGISVKIQLFEKVLNEKNWLVFDVKDMEDAFEKDGNLFAQKSTYRYFSDMIINGKKQPENRWKRCHDYLIDMANNNKDTFVPVLLTSENMASDEFQDFFIKNFKDIAQSKDTLSYIIRTIPRQEKEIKDQIIKFFFKLFDGDEIKAAEGMKNLNSFGNAYTFLSFTSNFSDPKAVEIFIKTQIKNMNSGTLSDSFEKVLSKTTIPSLLSDYGFMDIVENGLDKLPPKQFDKFLATIFPGKKEATYINAIRKKILMGAVVSELYDDKKSLIQPNKKLDKKRLNEILKFNNVSVKLPPKLRRKKGENTKSYFKRIQKNHKELKSMIEPLKIDEIKETDEELERKTADYLQYYNFKHGNSALEFLKSFNVNMMSKELKEWMKEHPKPTVIPFFHGTGSIGASMILRYGFKILKKTDKSVVGRMLGDGIYISNIIEKSAQYIGDHGFSRRRGTIGYILEGDAYLGTKDDYKSAGTGNDRILSPEYVLFNARAQLHIKKAHKVRMTTKNFVKGLAKKYGIDHRKKTNDNRYYGGFQNLLTESTKPNNMITYIFYDGTCIDEKENIVEFEVLADRFSHDPKIIVTLGQLGPEINIRTSADVLGSVHIPSTLEFQQTNPEDLYDQYLTILTDAIEGEYDE